MPVVELNPGLLECPPPLIYITAVNDREFVENLVSHSMVTDRKVNVLVVFNDFHLQNTPSTSRAERAIHMNARFWLNHRHAQARLQNWHPGSCSRRSALQRWDGLDYLSANDECHEFKRSRVMYEEETTESGRQSRRKFAGSSLERLPFRQGSKSTPRARFLSRSYMTLIETWVHSGSRNQGSETWNQIIDEIAMWMIVICEYNVHSLNRLVTDSLNKKAWPLVVDLSLN